MNDTIHFAVHVDTSDGEKSFHIGADITRENGRDYAELWDDDSTYDCIAAMAADGDTRDLRELAVEAWVASWRRHHEHYGSGR